MDTLIAVLAFVVVLVVPVVAIASTFRPTQAPVGRAADARLDAGRH
ncbi:hypothetical protein FHX74_003119 [Friedmanniella endophytica]|uniref:Uncharacterized protein n=1 Tax=Microlunatus kandeliicorticis TaxID=1759536 RepID=A0A7W3IUG4_9ACTN|nr:hypothetical protein [Microlunatus kandeliicorticis]MBA8795483.1 hypothetical protein [Microlunatus kandeliicorticis]